LVGNGMTLDEAKLANRHAALLVNGQIYAGVHDTNNSPKHHIGQ
jgi:hypothetical protein